LSSWWAQTPHTLQKSSILQSQISPSWCELWDWDLIVHKRNNSC
jgi:hypothetical protein